MKKEIIEINSNKFQKLISQINFILVRFNLPSEIFAKEINYLLTNAEDPSFSISSFNDKLLSRIHHFLILESWTSEKNHFTNKQQVQAVQRLLRILDLNDWLELARKVEPVDYDPWPYQLIREQANSKLQRLVRRFKPSESHQSTYHPPETSQVLTEIFAIYLNNLLSEAETAYSPAETIPLRAKLDYFRSGRNWFPERVETIEKTYQGLGEKLKSYQSDQFSRWFSKKKKNPGRGLTSPT
jgi:hypothetical protein